MLKNHIETDFDIPYRYKSKEDKYFIDLEN